MYIVATAQPHMKEADGPSEHTIQLTRLEKRKFSDALDAGEMLTIPLTIDHADADAFYADTTNAGMPYDIPARYRIGHLEAGMVDADGSLLLVCQISPTKTEFDRVLRGILNNNERWGLSLGTDIAWRDADELEIGFKRISHVGVTLHPAYGPEGSYFHDVALDSNLLLRDVLPRYLSRPGLYAPRNLRERVAAALRGAYSLPTGMTRIPTHGGSHITVTATRPGAPSSLDAPTLAVRPLLPNYLCLVSLFACRVRAARAIFTRAAVPCAYAG